VGCSQAPPPVEPQAEPKAAESNAKDTAAIKALEDRFLTAFKAKDVNAIMAVYVPDASLFVFDTTPPRQYVGAPAYRKDWEELFGMFPGPMQVDLSDVDVTAGGVRAQHSARHRHEEWQEDGVYGPGVRWV
jgi:ketosteroid isomerase-like protein